MSKMFSPPAWHPTAVPTERGWIVPETGELLVACKDLCTLIAEFKAGKITGLDAESEIALNSVEPVKEIEDAPAQANEPEQEQNDLADAEVTEGSDEGTESGEAEVEQPTEGVTEEPKRRGRKPKAK